MYTLCQMEIRGSWNMGAKIRYYSRFKYWSELVKASKLILFYSNIEGGKLKEYKPILTKAATWEPINGLIMYDSLFPHINHGFRNRTIPIATYHVIFQSFSNWNILCSFENCFFFSPEPSLANSNIQWIGPGDWPAWHIDKYTWWAGSKTKFQVNSN